MLKNSPKIILIVDDMVENMELLARNLQRFGYQTLLSSCGHKAIEIAEEKVPDLILLDVHMPGITGIEVCKKLKLGEKTKDIPVIFLTVKTEQETIVGGFAAGAVDYILKPFYNEELFARINTHLQLKELQTRNDAMEQYHQTVDGNIAILHTDKDGKIVYASKAFCDITGCVQADLIGVHESDFEQKYTKLKNSSLFDKEGQLVESISIWR